MRTLFDFCTILFADMARTAGSRNFTPEIQQLVMRKREAGEGKSQIARSLCLSRAAVDAIIQRGGRNSPKSGRSPSLSPQLERRVVRESRKHPDRYATEIVRKLNLNVTPQTVRNYLKKAGLKNRIARLKPALTRVQKRNRLRFAKEHAQKPLSFWHSILWSDESKIVSRPNPRGAGYGGQTGKLSTPNMYRAHTKAGEPASWFGVVAVRLV